MINRTKNPENPITARTNFQVARRFGQRTNFNSRQESLIYMANLAIPLIGAPINFTFDKPTKKFPIDLKNFFILLSFFALTLAVTIRIPQIK